MNYQYRILGIHNSQTFGIVGIDDSQTFGFVGIDNSQTITLCTSLLSEEIDHRCRFFLSGKVSFVTIKLEESRKYPYRVH